MRAPRALLGVALLGAAACACDADEPVSTGTPSPTDSAAVEPAGPAAAAATATPSPSNAPRPPAPDPRDGPWNRDLVAALSPDGLAFTPASTFVERAGVPCVIRDRDGRLIAVFQWFPLDRRDAFDRVAFAVSDDEGRTWSPPEPVALTGLPSDLMRPFDPTIVQLPDGRYRLYFTSNTQGPAGRPAIYSAVSSDAVSYTFEPGARLAPAGGAVDCSVVFFDGAWHLFAHNQQAFTGRGYHAMSVDGLAWTSLADVDAGSGRQWIGNAIVVGRALRYYGSGQAGVWSASSADGTTWTADAGTRVPAAGDASAVILASGEVLLVAVGPIRADAVARPPF